MVEATRSRLDRLGWLFHFPRLNVHVVHIGLSESGNTQTYCDENNNQSGKPQMHIGEEFAQVGWSRVPGENLTATSN